MIGCDPSPARKGLIGHTGFVGGALLRQTRFDACFNRTNIADLGELSFRTLICAAAPGSMFEANRAPERDAAQIAGLIAQLGRARADRFVLISTIAVLEDFAGGDDEGTQAFQQTLAYGRHRRELEAFVEEHFAQSLIVRLPALFGTGLVKNFIFDLMNPVPTMLPADKCAALSDRLSPALGPWLRNLYAPDAATGMLRLDRAALNADRRRAALEDAVTAADASAVQFHHPETTYQYYPIDRLWQDIGIALEAGLTHLHLVAEPLRAGTIHARMTGRAMPDTGARLHAEDMHTRHADLWGTSGHYQFGAQTTLDHLAAFFASQRAAA
ncbi:MAG TPA: hypothetical protein VLA50_08045 [Erythrobacter sp.]|nr:hypothetical protein [Erythrobacter sp.]